MEKPHIIYILSDEHRGQAMGHLGDPNVKTPCMDRMAAEGASFKRAYANCPVCTPSRGTIFSGRHAHSGPVGGFFDVYKANSPSTAKELRKVGYHTAYFGKWHMGIVRDQLPEELPYEPAKGFGPSLHRTPERHRGGFQDWNGFESLNRHFESLYYHNNERNPRLTPGYETDGLTDLVIDYLNQYDREEPLFLVLSVTPPHFPLIVPEQWERFAPEELKVRDNFVDTPENRENLAKYYAMIENLDHNIGRLQDTLQASPKFKNTLSVYFSDHGDFMGSHGLINTKAHPPEESIRIPAIFHWPEKIPAQGNIDGLFSLVDLQSTILGLTETNIPSYDQGTNWAPRLQGEAFTGPESVLIEMEGNHRGHLQLRDWRGILQEHWKYAFYETGEELLFDLEADPYEMNNLARKLPEKKESMKQELLKLLAENREPYFDVIIEHGMPTPQEKSLNLDKQNAQEHFKHYNALLNQ